MLKKHLMINIITIKNDNYIFFKIEQMIKRILKKLTTPYIKKLLNRSYNCMRYFLSRLYY